MKKYALIWVAIRGECREAGDVLLAGEVLILHSSSILDFLGKPIQGKGKLGRIHRFRSALGYKLWTPFMGISLSELTEKEGWSFSRLVRNPSAWESEKM